MKFDDRATVPTESSIWMNAILPSIPLSAVLSKAPLEYTHTCREKHIPRETSDVQGNGAVDGEDGLVREPDNLKGAELDKLVSGL